MEFITYCKIVSSDSAAKRGFSVVLVKNSMINICYTLKVHGKPCSDICVNTELSFANHDVYMHLNLMNNYNTSLKIWRFSFKLIQVSVY